jgi:hypothetical protein
MPCALCQKNRPLHRSHIVPEFMYRALYDAKHQFHGLRRDRSDKPQKFDKGLREKLLCAECEAQFSRYESYAALFFYGKAKLHVRREGKHITITGVDYKLLKLFCLSLLWRFGVTSLDFLSGASLGPQHRKTAENARC